MRAGILVILAAIPGIAENRIGAIDFFGYKGIDVEAVRAALPVHVGDPLEPTEESMGKTIERVAEAVEKATGREPTDIAPVCCIGRGDWMIYIGLAGASSKEFVHNPEPEGEARLPEAAVALNRRLADALMPAVRSSASEDRSQGYAVSSDLTMRAVQIELRAWALDHEPEIYAALGSSDAEHRAMAAWALGYVLASARQVDGLAKASRDPESTVRNNATRALAVLAEGKPELLRSLDPTTFIAMLQSDVWSDRNKGAALLTPVVAAGDAALRARIRVEALDALREMAAWTSEGHSSMARAILEQIGAR